MRIAIQGLWHLGLVTAAGLLKNSHDVIGYSDNLNEIENLKNNKLPIYEPGLNQILKENYKKKKIKFYNNLDKSRNTKTLWYCLDTPINKNNQPDVNFIINKIKKTIFKFKHLNLLIISSQIPLGTVNKLESIFKKKKRKIDIVYVPENLRLGKSLKIFLNPDRVIVGCRNNVIFKKIQKILFFQKEKLVKVKPESAELIKHSINCFLALSVCFINEIDNVSKKFRANSSEIEYGLKSEERIGFRSYLGPGPAFSGGTLGRDVNILENLSKKNKLNNFIIKNINKSNNYRKSYLERKFNELKINKKSKIVFLGLAYKQNTSTLRNSYSITFANWLLNKKYKNIFLHDDYAKKNELTKRLGIFFVNDLIKTIKKADIILIINNQPNYKIYQKIIKTMKKKLLLYDPFQIIKFKKNKNIHYL